MSPSLDGNKHSTPEVSEEHLYVITTVPSVLPLHCLCTKFGDTVNLIRNLLHNEALASAGQRC